MKTGKIGWRSWIGVCLALAVATPAGASTPGQTYSGTDWGSVVGMTYATAKACGASQAQLEAYKRRNLAKGRGMDPSPDYAAKFESGFKQGVDSMTPLVLMGGGKPDPGSCKTASAQLAE
ncbi:hypothetical protein [Xanthomonas massiliensis]|jgi:hypothetical protein|uniref:hypothetical protein n=1 Tax=Xanthomonas massiliensis TaxID=1720302 RepID=UPI000ADD0904|nr:hypothetical protein [Xanthomonas massiliensis]